MKLLLTLLLLVISGLLAQQPEEKKIDSAQAIQLENLELKITNLWLTFQKQQDKYNKDMQELNAKYKAVMEEVQKTLAVTPEEWQYAPEQKVFVKRSKETKK